MEKRLELLAKELYDAHILCHPARAFIIKYLRDNNQSYIKKISEDTGLKERVVAFHISMLSTSGFVEGEYGLEHNPSRIVRYYKITPKVDEALEGVARFLKG